MKKIKYILAFLLVACVVYAATPIRFRQPVEFTNLTATTVPYLDASKLIISSAITPTELGYLSGASANLQTQLDAITFDALSPMTTAGDIITGGASGAAQRLAVGTDGQVLKVSGSSVVWGADNSGASSTQYDAVTLPSTTTSSSGVISVSGASGTLSLHTAVGNQGQVLKVIHGGTSLTQVYTIDPNSTETIRGQSNFLLHTAGQTVEFISDGANWQVLNHITNTGWVDGGNVTLTSTGGGVVKGTLTTDKIQWFRVGDTAFFKITMIQTTAGTAGTGGYNWALPANMTGNPLTTTDSTSTVKEIAGAQIGNMSGMVTGSTQFECAVHATSTTTVGAWVAGIGRVGSAYMSLGNSNIGYSLVFKMEIDGWEY